MKRSRNINYLGFLGFLGFIGFRYFSTNDITILSYFAFFGFFAYFIISRISHEMVDERYVENSRNAKAFTFNIAVIEFIVLFSTAPFNFMTKEILTVLCALCFASLNICYAIAFYRFEKI